MKKLIYENERGQSITLSNSRPFLLETIQNTGGIGTDIITTKSPEQDGVSWESTTLKERIIPVTGAIISPIPEDMDKKRFELCSVFNPKLRGKLSYTNNIGTHTIDCNIQDGVTFQSKVGRMQKFLVQFLCPNPFWQDLKEEKEEIALWVGDFMFPLIIPQDTGIRMGHRQSSLIVNIFNKGDVECGMKIEFKALATVKNPSLFNINTREFIRINRDLKAGDRLEVNTSFGNKRVELVRNNGTRENVFYYVDLESEFLQLEVGDNLFRYDAEQGIDNLEVSIYHRPLYLGV